VARGWPGSDSGRSVRAGALRPGACPLGRQLMPDKSATALTAEYPPRVAAGRRIISRPDGPTDRATALTARCSAQVVRPAGSNVSPAAAGRVLSVSAQDKWRRRRRQQRTTTHSRKQNGESWAEVDRQTDSKRERERERERAKTSQQPDINTDVSGCSCC